MAVYLTTTKLSSTAVSIPNQIPTYVKDTVRFTVAKGAIADQIAVYMIIEIGDFVGRVTNISDEGANWGITAMYDHELYEFPSTLPADSYYYYDGYKIAEVMQLTNKTKTGFYGDSHRRYHTIVDYELAVNTQKIDMVEDEVFDMLISQDLFISEYCFGQPTSDRQYPYRAVWLDEDVTMQNGVGRFRLNFGLGNQNRYRL